MRIPVLPNEMPRRGGVCPRAVGRVAMRILGWTTEGDLPNVPRCVFIVAPHTSNWDFVVGMACALAMELRGGFLAKHTLFWGPLGAFLRATGGIPVDRGAPEGITSQIAGLLTAAERCCIAIAPEGTRRRAERWKTGFHRIARAAGVPIVPVSMDWSRRLIRFLPPFQATEDAEADVAVLRQHFSAAMAFRPDQYV